MTTVYCYKLKKEAEGLGAPPYPGPLGARIQKEISKEAWQLWLKQQTMIINENRLKLFEPAARKMIEEAMVKFLFES